MRACLDEGILQSYFDGELSSERMESVTSHLASCSSCSAAARELESENNLLASALAPEFEDTVPTEHLRHRIDTAVAGLRVVSPNVGETAAPSVVSGWFQSLSDLFRFTPQRAFGYAGLVVVLAFASIFVVIHWRQTPVVPSNEIAKGSNDRGSNPDVRVETPSPEINVTPASDQGPSTIGVTPKGNRPIKSRLTPNNRQLANHVKLLPGERSYLKAIAALDSTIKNDRPMKPSLQAEYERNLALVDRALAAARNAAKSNPNDPDTTEFMFSAYQSKVDLLNTVADARLYNRQH